ISKRLSSAPIPWSASSARMALAGPTSATSQPSAVTALTAPSMLGLSPKSPPAASNAILTAIWDGAFGLRGGFASAFLAALLGLLLALGQDEHALVESAMRTDAMRRVLAAALRADAV